MEQQKRRRTTGMDVEIYSNSRMAELMLNNAVDSEDYARMRELVRQMGLDPDKIAHERPQYGRDKGGSDPGATAPGR